jgi:hypothetical protein
MQNHLKILALGLAISVAVPLSGMAAAAPARVDGVYTGASQLVPGSEPSCQVGTPISVKVTDGRFHFAWRPAQGTVVRIGAAGGYSAMLRGSFVDADKHMTVLPQIDGRTDGPSLVGDYGTRWCKYTYRLDRS